MKIPTQLVQATSELRYPLQALDMIRPPIPGAHV